MTRREECNSITLEDAIQVFRDTNAYGTMDLAKTVILEALEQKTSDDCISRAEAIKALEYTISVQADSGFDKYREAIKHLVNASYNKQKKAIENLPSIQPKKAHWIKHKHNGKPYFNCSECSYFVSIGYNYCPGCGAKMEAQNE